jgi:hypothetical protein
MNRTTRAVVLAAALAIGLGALMIGVPADVRADPKPPVICNSVTCEANQLCCVTGCPPVESCVKKFHGGCPPLLPCPAP